MLKKEHYSIPEWYDMYDGLPIQSILELPLPKVIPERDFGPIDPKIRNLVRVLNVLGLETTGSCERHLRDRSNAKSPFPWVVIPSFLEVPNVRRKTNLLLERFNEESPIQ